MDPFERPTLMGQPVDIDNPPEEYFEAMRRLRPEPPDEETVERIMEIARRIWRKQEQEELAEQEGVGVGSPAEGTLRD